MDTGIRQPPRRANIGPTRARVKGLLHAFVLGGATGLRSMAAPSQLSWRLGAGGLPRGAGRVADLLARDPVRYLLQVAAAGELIGDKLPTTPSRLEPGPLLGRVVLGAVCGGVLARLSCASGAAGALLGGAGAVLGAQAGYHARRGLVKGVGLPDFAVAVCEDVIACAAAGASVRGAQTR